MVSQNKALFADLKKIHDQYSDNKNSCREQFNEKGSKILEIIRSFENKLCLHTENGGFGRYSASLSNKFWEEIRNYLPKIDEVGII